MQFKELYRSVKNAARYASKEESRGALCGVRIEPTGDSIVVTATDGHVMYSEEHQCEHGLGAAFTLDAKKFLTAHKHNAKSGFSVAWGGRWDTLEGNYPNWRVGVPTSFRLNVELAPQALSSLTLQCNAVGGSSNKKTGLVKFGVSDVDGVSFSAVNRLAMVSTVGVGVECAVRGDGPDEVGFNYKYLGRALQDMWDHFAWNPVSGKKDPSLNAIDLEWGFNTAVSASVLQGGWCRGRRLTVLVMPLRIYD